MLSPSSTATPLPGSPLKRRPSRSDRFRFHLILLLVLTVLPALGLAVYTGFEQRRLGMRHARQQAALLARVAAANQERLLDNTRHVLAALAELPAINLANAQVWNSHFRNMLRLQPRYINFGLLETNGTLFANALPYGGPRDFSGSSFYQEVLRTRSFAIGELETGPLTNRPTLTFGYPVLDDSSRLTRIVFATVDVTMFGELAAGTQLPAESVLLVLDRGGHVLCHTLDSEKWLGESVPNSPLFQTLSTKLEGTAELPGLDGKLRLYAFASLRPGGEAGLFTAVGVAKDVAYASANKALFRNLTLIVLAALLALLVANLHARRYLLHPVQVLTEAARRLMAGDLSARTGLTGPADLNQLAQTFDEMAAALQRRQIQIEQAGQQIQAMNTDLERRITERQQAEEQVRASLREKEVMLKEIHHRVKNNLQVVSSLLRLQAHNLKNPETLAAFNESCIRVQSMALVHEKLYQSNNLSELDFAAYAQSLTDSLLISFGTDPSVVRLRIDMEKVRLDINQAIPCALILNELVSNALKYAFPNGRSGELWLRMRCDTAGRVCLVVGDNGIGLPADFNLEKVESLGLQLVSTLVRQLRGRIEISRAEGTQYTLTFTAEPATLEGA